MIKIIKTSNRNFYTEEGFHIVTPSTDIEYYNNKFKYLNKNLSKEDIKYKKVTSEVIDEKIANLTQLTFEVIDSCNMNCTYCAYGDLYSTYNNRNSKLLNTKKAIALIDYLVPIWNSNRSHSVERNQIQYG